MRIAESLERGRLPVSDLVLGVVGVLASSFLLGVGIATSNMVWVLVGPVSLLVLAVLLGPHQLSVFLLTALVFTMDWLVTDLRVLPQRSTLLIDLMIGLSLLRGALNWLQCRKLQLGKGPTLLITLPVLLFTGWAVLSVLVNSVPLLVATNGLRSSLKYVVLFYAIISLPWTAKIAQRFVSLLILLGWVQIVVSLLQYVMVRPRDQISGTMGLNAGIPLGFYLIAVACLSLGLYLFHSPKPLYLALTGLIFAPLALGSIRGALLVSIPVLLFVARERVFKGLRASVLAIAVISGTFYLSLSYLLPIVSPRYAGRGLLDLFSPEAIILEASRAGKAQELGRLEIFEFVRYASDYPSMGVGLGNASPNNTGEQGIYYVRHGTLRVFRTDLGRIVFELGYVGLALHILIIVAVFLALHHAARSLTDSFWIGIVRGMEGIVVAYALYIPYYPISISDIPAFTFWGLAGMVLVSTTARKAM